MPSFHPTPPQSSLHSLLATSDGTQLKILERGSSSLLALIIKSQEVKCGLGCWDQQMEDYHVFSLPPSLLLHAHSYAQIYTYTHTHKNTHTHIKHTPILYTLIHAQTHMYTHTHISIKTCTHINIYTYTYTIQTYTHTCAN